MEDLYATMDYRAWLKVQYESRKAVNRNFSYRYMALRLDMDSGHLVKILQGRLHLAEHHVPALGKMLGLDLRARRYLTTCIRLAKSATPEEERMHIDELRGLREVRARELDAAQYRYYQSWLPTALRGLASIAPQDTSADALASRLLPRPSPLDVRHALDTLVELGMLVPREEGGWDLQERHIRTGSWKDGTVRLFQHDTIRLASEALERIPAPRRDISTMTITLAEGDLPKLRERVAELRRDLARLAEVSDPPDGVFQVNIQVFPLTVAPE